MQLKNEAQSSIVHEENKAEKSDLYLLTMDMVTEKITFEEWVKLTIRWAKDVMQQTDHLESRGSKKE